jgi:hypothetical protein
MGGSHTSIAALETVVLGFVTPALEKCWYDGLGRARVSYAP